MKCIDQQTICMYYEPITLQIDIWGGLSSGSRAETWLIKSQNQSSLHEDDEEYGESDDEGGGDDDDGCGDDDKNGKQ